MATRSQFKMSTAERRRRTFSPGFKQSKVKEIERGLVKVSDICREYEVSSASVYAWLDKYGTAKNKPERMIVEKKSDTAKLKELRKQIAELERIIGQKQVLIDFQDKMISIAEEHYCISIKKKFSGTQSDITGKTEKK